MTKKSRPVLGHARNVLTVDDRQKGYHYRWMNTDDDRWASRVADAEAAGYEVVHDKRSAETQVGDASISNRRSLGSAVSKPAGNGVRAILMRVPEEIYREAQEAKQQDIDEIEAGIYRETNSREDGQYGGRFERTNVSGHRMPVEVGPVRHMRRGR